MIRILIVNCVTLAAAVVLALGSTPGMAEQVNLSSRSTISLERKVLSISCKGALSAPEHDALCKALYRQIKDIVPGYVYRLTPDLDAAPTRVGDVRVKLNVTVHLRTMTMQLEWYSGSQIVPQKGPAIESGPLPQTPREATDAVTVLLNETPRFRAMTLP